jgi:hypothetical protein
MFSGAPSRYESENVVLVRSRILLAATSIAVCVSACGERDDLAWAPQAEADSVHVFLESIPSVLGRAGPLGWLEVFDSAGPFFMASDGRVAFADRAAAQGFLADFAPSVVGMDLTWGDLRVEPLSPGLVSFGAGYRERIEVVDGAASEFGGYVTGVVRRTADGWRLQHLHWSSPAT